MVPTYIILNYYITICKMAITTLGCGLFLVFNPLSMEISSTRYLSRNIFCNYYTCIQIFGYCSQVASNLDTDTRLDDSRRWLLPRLLRHDENVAGMAQEVRSAVHNRWLALGLNVGSTFAAVNSVCN